MDAQEIKAKFGQPPSPTIVVWNPKSEQWVERVATWLCTDEHEVGAIPCAEHLRKARAARNELAPGMAKTPVKD